MSKFKAALITTLCVLTFTVIIYDIHVFNPPKVLWIQVWGHGEYGEEYSESWDTVVNITNHPLKEKITYYMNKAIQCWTRRIYIFNNPEIEAFFGK